MKIDSKLDSLLKIVRRRLLDSQIPPLNSTEVLIIQGIWECRTYGEMAEEAKYSTRYFTNVVAPKLFERLSELIGQRVTKKNCRRLLESYTEAAIEEDPDLRNLEQNSVETADMKQDGLPPYYSGPIPLDSPFYIERSPFEEQVYREIEKPGALIRIKAPKEMGKTSLLLRVIDCAEGLGYSTVCLNLEQVDLEILNNFNQFLRWMCANITRQLGREPMLEEYWDEDLGSKVSSTLYLQDYLLESIDTPLLLALDEVNRIFEYPQVAKDFLPLLRSWYEETKRMRLWQKLRLIVVHSTEIYVPLQLNQSPFNVGLPIQLDSFSSAEVQQLAQRYELDWVDGKEAERLMAMVGGHPGLVHLALYKISQEGITLSQLLENAPTRSGIYGDHLQRHWDTLEEQPKLAQALDTVLNATEPVRLDPTLTYKLSSMGLIKQLGDRAIAGCELYRRYFTNH